MHAHLLVGPVAISGSRRFSSSPFFPINGEDLSTFSPSHHRKSNRHRKVTAATSSSSSWSAPSPATISAGQNHYAVLGIERNATAADIKRAYRLLARKFHPDVSKDLRAGELFKSIRLAYEVLSNEARKSQYDRALRFQEDNLSHRVKRHYNSEYDDRLKFYRWSEMRRKMRYERYYKHHNMNGNSYFYDETAKAAEKQNTSQERGSFGEVLRSSFISLFLLNTFGSRFSLTFSSLIALFDKELDAGYKIGYVIAWVLGGRGGILLTLCLSFASWVCGKASSSVVVLVVVAMWVGTNLARYAPLPQGALLTLLYMSIKLQVGSS